MKSEHFPQAGSGRTPEGKLTVLFPFLFLVLVLSVFFFLVLFFSDGHVMSTTEEGMLERVKSGDFRDCQRLHNKAPRWNESLGAYCLNFNGRVTLPSVKNFQLQVRGRCLRFISGTFRPAQRWAGIMPRLGRALAHHRHRGSLCCCRFVRAPALLPLTRVCPFLHRWRVRQIRIRYPCSSARLGIRLSPWTTRTPSRHCRPFRLCSRPSTTSGLASERAERARARAPAADGRAVGSASWLAGGGLHSCAPAPGRQRSLNTFFTQTTAIIASQARPLCVRSQSY
jgi:hypothetical protein